MPMITKAPTNPTAIPNRFIKNTFSFKNHQPNSTDSMGIIKVSTEAFMTDVLLIPSKKKAMFKVMAKIPIATSFGRSCFLILIFLLSARKKGAIKREAKAKRNTARLMGGNSCKVILATTKLAPQIRWAISRAR